MYQTHVIEPSKVHDIRLTPPETFNVSSNEAVNKGGFSSEVWRVVFNSRATFALHGIDTHGYDIRPPMSREKPKLDWLAYGSSITQSNLVQCKS